MKLKYSMLWFDDDKDQFSSYDFNDLITQINSWGFDFDSPTYVQTVQEFMDKAPFTEFDLIVVDYNIGEDNEHGDDFIQKVRDQKIYTEVVFYTAGDITKLWESVKERQGVHLRLRCDLTGLVSLIKFGFDPKPGLGSRAAYQVDNG